MSKPPETQYPMGTMVRIKHAEPHDNVRGVYDGAVGQVIASDIWQGDKRNPYLVRSPLVRFPDGDFWMAMHKLEAAQ